MLRVTGLTKEFQSGDQKVLAVHDVTMEVPDGTFGAIVGKSGSGKSTLLSLLGALDKPTSGTIELDGQNVTAMGDARLIAYRRDTIGFVFQSFNLIPNMTALENVMLPMEFAGVQSRQARERATQLLEQLGVAASKHKRLPGRLSGGEQQRVAIARALANKPRLILADEPTGNLDSATSKMIIDILKDLAVTQNTTVIVVTHDGGIAQQAQQTFHLKDGALA
ncbi:MAG: ABC transporter ATP-binding protein [Candidatus Cryosericum sp.]